MATATKHCTVVFALPDVQWQWSLEVPATASVAEALRAARELAGSAEVPWDAEVGIFGEFC